LRHGLAERAVDGEPSRLGPPAAYIGLVVCVPRLIPPIRLPDAGDLSVHGLVALADPGSDRLDRLVTAEPIGDFDSVVLAQIPRADRSLDVAHAASVDEPQRPTAQRHTNPLRGLRTRQPRPDQLEVATLDRRRHPVRRIPRHADPFRWDSQRSLETAGRLPGWCAMRSARRCGGWAAVAAPPRWRRSSATTRRPRWPGCA